MIITNKKAILLLIFLVVSVVFISGCTTQEQGAIKTEEQVSEAVDNVSTGVGEIGDTLKDIDNTLG